MIVVKVELWPSGSEKHAIDLGKAIIANETDLAPVSDYSVRLLKGALYSSRPGEVYKRGEVRGWPRRDKRIGPWEMLVLALESALGGRIERARKICADNQNGGAK